MTKCVKIDMKNNFTWLIITFVLTLLASYLIHPAVVLGVIIGVTTTVLKKD